MSARLDLEQVVVRFGGLTAVDGVSLTVSGGQVVGLIGPNGAGKTTTFNACSGLAKASEGRIVFNGHDVTKLSPQRRARLGLGRTFQQVQLYDRLTVEENVAMGREARLTSTRRLTGLLWNTLEDRRDIADATERAIERCGIGHLLGRNAGSLPSGARRLVELARALAGGYELILLDEPSAGLDHDETGAFGEVLRRAVHEDGIGILLVEHDMALVRSTCEWVYVLDFGKPLIDGPTNDVLSSAQVRAAYLGAEVA